MHFNDEDVKRVWICLQVNQFPALAGRCVPWLAASRSWTAAGPGCKLLIFLCCDFFQAGPHVFALHAHARSPLTSEAICGRLMPATHPIPWCNPLPQHPQPLQGSILSPCPPAHSNRGMHRPSQATLASFDPGNREHHRHRAGAPDSVRRLVHLGFGRFADSDSACALCRRLRVRF